MLNSKLINPTFSTLPPRPMNNLRTPRVESPFDTSGRSQANAPLSLEIEQATANYLAPAPREQIEDPSSNVKPNHFYLNTPYDTSVSTYKYNLNYDLENLHNAKNYTIEQPILEPINPLMVSNSPFYPYPDFDYKINPNYKTYPYYNDYLGKMPAYRYPYNTAGPNSPIKKKIKKKFKRKEHFNTNLNNEQCAYAIIGMAFIIIVITISVN